MGGYDTRVDQKAFVYLNFFSIIETNNQKCAIDISEDLNVSECENLVIFIAL